MNFEIRSGVYNDVACNSQTINHAVTIVGYGVQNTTINYWVVRNSWGTGWGQKGYILMVRGTNLCHIEEYVYYVAAA